MNNSVAYFHVHFEGLSMYLGQSFMKEVYNICQNIHCSSAERFYCIVAYLYCINVRMFKIVFLADESPVAACVWCWPLYCAFSVLCFRPASSYLDGHRSIWADFFLSELGQLFKYNGNQRKTQLKFDEFLHSVLYIIYIMHCQEVSVL